MNATQRYFAKLALLTMLSINLLMACYGAARPPEVWLYQRDNSFMWIVQKEPVDMPDSWHFSCARADVFFMGQEDALKYLTFNWLDPEKGSINLTFFAVLATGWEGKAVSDPNEPPVAVDDPNFAMPMVWMSFTGTKYHRKDCRYVSDTFVEVDIITALQIGLQGCSICKPEFYGD